MNSKRKNKRGKGANDIVDYWSKLTTDERKWLWRFNTEFHSAKYLNLPDSIHTDPEMVKELERAYYRFRNDLMNASAEQIASSLKASKRGKHSKRPAKKNDS